MGHRDVTRPHAVDAFPSAIWGCSGVARASVTKAPVPGRDTATRGSERARAREREVEEVYGLGLVLEGLSGAQLRFVLSC